MKRKKLICILIFIVGILVLAGIIGIQQEGGITAFKTRYLEQFDIKSVAASTNMLIKEKKTADTPEAKEQNETLTEIKMETAPAAVLRIEVYGNMTLEEVAAQLNKSLKNDISNKGMVIASKSIELGVDPFIATAIILHETGCGQNQCSNIARNCYNFGGQKGSGCGAYKRYNSVDEGLEGMISNLYKNYYAHGLTTVETIGPRYAESDTWVSKINWYVSKIKSS